MSWLYRQWYRRTPTCMICMKRIHRWQRSIKPSTFWYHRSCAHHSVAWQYRP